MAVIRWLLLVCLLVASSAASAAIEIQHFDDPALDGRYRALTERLRCPKCQNESIGASNSPISADMRARVAERLRAGDSDAEIEQAMISRFGDYVLYDPRLDARTWLLWGLPFALVVVGGGVIAAFVIRRRRLRHADLDAEERRRLQALMARHTDDAAKETS
ncbi:cytochrome c-type biogenesis protein [Salinicola avicenniae]|uniref:cytochrome c-type biogenesis protein n=1 Tax=Salinicola avicenniae TaxID=2916836 RepID=UPI0020740608|nr:MULTISPECIES: cytochrome c-type biogenesis protein [unclassified Salinicola]